MPRRKKVIYKPRKRKQTTTPIDCLEGLPAPNHLHHPANYDTDDDLLCNTHDGMPRFPLLNLMQPESPNTATPGSLAFVDPRYGFKSWADFMTVLGFCDDCTGGDAHAFIQRPPTWMDPEVFVRMLVKHPRTVKLVRMYMAKGHSGKRIKMNEHVQDVFEEEYLVYMIEQFAKVRDLLAQWVIAHLAIKERERAEREKRKRRKSSKGA